MEGACRCVLMKHAVLTCWIPGVCCLGLGKMLIEGLQRADGWIEVFGPGCMVVLAFCSRLACCTGIIERLLGRALKKHTSKCVVEQRFAICFDVIFDRCTRPAVLLAICRIEVFAENELIVNITDHELVPKHVPLSDEEKQQLLNRFGYLSKKLEREPDTSWFHQSELQKHEKKTSSLHLPFVNGCNRIEARTVCDHSFPSYLHSSRYKMKPSQLPRIQVTDPVARPERIASIQ